MPTQIFNGQGYDQMAISILRDVFETACELLGRDTATAEDVAKTVMQFAGNGHLERDTLIDRVVAVCLGRPPL